MSNFDIAFKKLCGLEFSDNPSKFLHKNEGEDGFTLGGVYQKANPIEFSWNFILQVLEVCNNDIERASIMLYNDEKTQKELYDFFKKNYWERCRLDSLYSQSQAENIFFSGVHIGVKNAVKLAQKVVQTEQDGYLGDKTVKAMNFYDDTMFKTSYDRLEIENYNNLIERNPALEWARDGFINRAYFA